jgi:hypothetical protein
MRTLASTLNSRIINPAPVVLRIAVHPGEVFRLPEAGQRIRVTSGRAWISAQGRDVVLGPREQLTFTVSAEAALISALHHAPVMLEVLN